MFGIDEAIHGHVRQITQQQTANTGQHGKPNLRYPAHHFIWIARGLSTQVAANKIMNVPEQYTAEYKYLHFIQGPAACYY